MQHSTIHGSDHYSLHVMMPLCCVITVLHSEAVSVSFLTNFPSNTALLHQEKKKWQNPPWRIFVVFEGLSHSQWFPQVSPHASCRSDSGSWGHTLWQWWVTFATVSGPTCFNRHSPVQWTALWVNRIPLLPAVALLHLVIWSLLCGLGGGSRWGVGAGMWDNSGCIRTKLVLKDEHTRTHLV